MDEHARLERPALMEHHREARHAAAHQLPAQDRREDRPGPRELRARPSTTHKYIGTYEYFYCTKSNHFSYVIDKVLDKGVNLETSSAYDLEMIELLIERGRITKDSHDPVQRLQGRALHPQHRPAGEQRLQA